MLKLKINGQEKEFIESDFPQTLSALLAHLSIAEETVVAEVNAQIIERKNFASEKLKPDSQIELIRFVGGG
jgi:thiamine biosynthesis protein ThiS